MTDSHGTPENMTDNHGTSWSTEDDMHIRTFVKQYKQKKKKHQDQYGHSLKRREVNDVPDDDTIGKMDKSVAGYETNSKAWHNSIAPYAAKAMPKLQVLPIIAAPEPKNAMPSPSMNKVNDKRAAATGSVSKATVDSSAAAAASSAAANSATAAIDNSDGASSAADASNSGGEAWRTTRQDITVWNEVVTTHGVDKAACQDLFLLAQHSTEGYQEANNIISKIIKKQQDKQLVTNTSGFVHRCVLNVRHKLMS